MKHVKFKSVIFSYYFGKIHKKSENVGLRNPTGQEVALKTAYNIVYRAIGCGVPQPHTKNHSCKVLFKCFKISYLIFKIPKITNVTEKITNFKRSKYKKCKYQRNYFLSWRSNRRGCFSGIRTVYIMYSTDGSCGTVTLCQYSDSCLQLCSQSVVVAIFTYSIYLPKSAVVSCCLCYHSYLPFRRVVTS